MPFGKQVNDGLGNAFPEMDDVKPTEERGAWERGLGNAFPGMDDVKPTEERGAWERGLGNGVSRNG